MGEETDGQISWRAIVLCTFSFLRSSERKKIQEINGSNHAERWTYNGSIESSAWSSGSANAGVLFFFLLRFFGDSSTISSWWRWRQSNHHEVVLFIIPNPTSKTDDQPAASGCWWPGIGRNSSLLHVGLLCSYFLIKNFTSTYCNDGDEGAKLNDQWWQSI